MDTGYKKPGNLISENWSGIVALADIDVSDNTYGSHLGSTYQPLYVNNFAFSLPSGASIVGISVLVELRANAAHTAYIRASMSWNNGTNFTSTKETSTYYDTVDAVKYLGSSTDLWGRTWSDSEFADGTFQLCIEGKGDNATGRVYLDVTQVCVYYTTADEVLSVMIF
jgi:hypothetical protein